MNKQELIDAVAASTGMSKAAIGETIDAMLETITRALTSGHTIQRVSAPRGRDAILRPVRRDVASLVRTVF